MRLLVFNAGSSSLKYDLLELPPHGPAQRLATGTFTDAADGTGLLLPCSGPAGRRPLVPARTLPDAARQVLTALRDAEGPGGGNLLAGLDGTVHRIVHGGDAFRATTRLGAAELEALDGLGPLAPLHNPPALSVIEAVRDVLGPDLPTVGVFDTAYYADLPPAALHYAVPARWREQFGVRRYGFHGTAHRYLCAAVRARLEGTRETRRIVSLQLGRGCSVTATLDGRAVATSMGFTPLEGLVMGTRSGDVDPGAVLLVMERSGMSVADMRRELNQASGLLGLSGRTADMRELLRLEQREDPGASLAIEVFCRRARHYLAAYLAELGGADAVVFGGGIGENAPEIRRRIVGGMEWAGLRLDAAANASSRGIAASLATPASRVAIEVLPVDEASIMAADAASLLAATPSGEIGGDRQPPHRGPALPAL